MVVYAFDYQILKYLGMVVHAFDPSIRRQKQAGFHEFEANLLDRH